MKLAVKCVGIHTRLCKTGPIGDMGFPMHEDSPDDTYAEKYDVDLVIKTKKHNINLYLPDTDKNEFIIGKEYEIEIREAK